MTGLAHDLGVKLVVTLGALLADVPHAFTQSSVAATDPALVEELGLQLSRSIALVLSLLASLDSSSAAAASS